MRHGDVETRELRVKLSAKERKECGEGLAKATIALEEHLVEAKKAKRALLDAQRAFEKTQHRLAEAVDTGFLTSDVVCQWRADTTGTRWNFELFRVDTGEVLDTRTMDEDERLEFGQGSLLGGLDDGYDPEEDELDLLVDDD